MNLFTAKQFDSMSDLMIDQLRDLYDAESRLMQALPEMAGAAHSPDLQAAFRNHLTETERQKSRLEEAFRKLGIEPERETCAAMKGLIREGQDVVNARGNPDVKDAALIAAAQRVEHYEIAGYGTARAFALELGRSDIAELLKRSLEEESHANELLNRLAEQRINVRAARSA